MDLRPFLIRLVEYNRLHRSNRMSAVAMYHPLKNLIERHYCVLVTLMPTFRLNIVRLWQFHVNEVHDFHSETIKQKTISIINYEIKNAKKKYFSYW